MTWTVLLAHADDEEDKAEILAAPLRDAGYDVVHCGTMLVGESITERASYLLENGSPVVLCGTVRAIGTGWANYISMAAKRRPNQLLFIVQMERDAYVSQHAWDKAIVKYWLDPTKAISELVQAIQKHCPHINNTEDYLLNMKAELRYRELALKSCDIINLANLPEMDRHVATRQFELRRLYVALRVRVEVQSESEPTQLNIDAIETRRYSERIQLGRNRGNHPEISHLGDSTSLGHRLEAVKKLIVLGDPGAGKTTMLRWIATAYLLRMKQDQDWKDLPDVDSLPDRDWLPIMVRCRDLDHSIVNQNLDAILLSTLLKSELTEDEANALRQSLREKLKEGKALLLIDGLDEISDPALRTRFCQQIEQIHIAYPEASMIITSRIVGYKELGYRIGRGFEHVTVADLTRTDKDDFARRWCAITEEPDRVEVTTQELIHDIHCTDRIERLTVNPMLLTTMALVKRKVGRLPSRRVDLYWDAYNVLLNWRREIDEPIDDREATPQLEYVAYAMCDRGVQKLREDEIIDLFENMRKEYPQVHPVKKHSSEEFLKLLERRTGILVETGFGRHLGKPVPLFEFRHLTFQEYLAGNALVDGRFPGRDRSKSLAQNVAPLAGRIVETEVRRKFKKQESTNSENWREALRLCVSSCNDDDVDQVLAAILNPAVEEDPTKTGRSRTVLAALCLADEPNVSDETAQNVLSHIVNHLGPNDGSENLFTGIDLAIKEIANTRWASDLLGMLVSVFVNRKGDTRENLAMLCGLVATALFEKSSSLDLWDYVEASQAPESQSFLPILSRILCLGYTSVEDSNHIVMKKRLPNTTQLEVLLVLAKKNADLSFSLSWSLSQVSNFVPRRKSTNWRLNTNQIGIILDILVDKEIHPATLINWLHVLGNMASKVEGPEILYRLNDENENVQEAAILALGKLKDSRCVEKLIINLSDHRFSVRMSSIWSLGKFHQPTALEPLIELLSDENLQIVRSAALSLAEMQDNRALAPLLSLVDGSRGIERDIALALGMLADKDNFDFLRQRFAGVASPLWNGFKNGLYTSACKFILSDDIEGIHRNILAITADRPVEISDHVNLMFCNILLGRVDKI